MVLRAGLTGGIGSGKSTVAGMFRSLGIPVVDTDLISHQLTEKPHGRALPQIQTVFGDAVFEPDGSFSRQRLRDLVFSSPAHKRQLEAILHPLIREEMQKQFLYYANQSDIVVLDIPLLAESDAWQSQLDRILVIDCSPQTQLNRVMARSGWPQKQVERVIAQQASREERLAIATDVIFNEGISLAQLRIEAQAVVARWRHELQAP